MKLMPDRSSSFLKATLATFLVALSASCCQKKEINLESFSNDAIHSSRGLDIEMKDMQARREKLKENVKSGIRKQEERKKSKDPSAKP